MDNQGTTARKGRFAPQLVEASSRSSKESTSSRSRNKDDSTTTAPAKSTSDGAGSHSPQSRSSTSPHSSPRHIPQSPEPPQKSTRFALPQPVETTSRSSKSSRSTASPDSTSSLPKKKFAPEPVETSSRSSRESSRSSRSSTEQRLNPENASKVSRRIEPQLVQSIKHRYRKAPENKAESGQEGRKSGPETELHFPPSGRSSPKSRPPRKFSPQLIETQKRSFRQPDVPENSILRLSDTSYSPVNAESKFSHASLARRKENKRHSFRVPDLPAIPSSSSEDSIQSPPASVSTSPSTVPDETGRTRQHKHHHRDSCDERFSGYLFSLAARSAEKQLRDQALAAFPNEQVYQPVAHFAIDQEDTDDEDEKMERALRDMKVDITEFRRESSANLGWELEELRRHKEESEMRARERLFEDTQSRFSAAAIAKRQAEERMSIDKPTTGGKQKDIKSPPMLGADIVFPQSLSPQSTRCDVDHTPAPHHDLNGESEETSDGPLWSADIHVDENDQRGLWMGTCQKTSEPDEIPKQIPRPGIVTPAVENENMPFQSLNSVTSAAMPAQLPNTPPDSDPRLESMDKMLMREQDIEREFNDAFVTQIYNYLSLGYPCLARDFDAELSKITHISIEELRKDDHHTNAKGYIGAPEGSGIDAEEIGGKCMRWVALKQYIHEWARQQPIMRGRDASLDAWGVRARRGSWAI